MRQEIIDAENRLMANVFAKRQIVITRGKAATLWDINGKEYVDCMGGYGVALLGHCHPKVVAAVCKQAETLISCHASLYNDKRTEFLQKLIAITPKGLNKAFLSNSGAESVECAIKLARKYTGKPEIIAMMGAFHGKTMGALSATWDKKYREPFLPLVPEFKHVPPDNLGQSQRSHHRENRRHPPRANPRRRRNPRATRRLPAGSAATLRRKKRSPNLRRSADELRTNRQTVRLPKLGRHTRRHDSGEALRRRLADRHNRRQRKRHVRAQTRRALNHFQREPIGLRCRMRRHRRARGGEPGGTSSHQLANTSKPSWKS